MYVMLCAMVFACTKDDDAPATPPPTPPASLVVFDSTQVPYQTLSTYNFYKGDLVNMEPQDDVLPYDLITPLFTDYAKKKRFVWFMPGSSASYDIDSEIFNFEDGAVIIKNFYYDNVQPEGVRRVIETRLLYKLNGQWKFAEYVWNEDQTEAYLDMNGSYLNISWLQEGDLKSTNYRIPSEAECLTCHKTNSNPVPIGPKPQNMNKLFSYSDGVKNQLTKWAEVGYLTGSIPADINTVSAWDDEQEPLELRVRAYLDINCASCHKEDSHCDYRPMRFAWSETLDPQNQGVCVPPDEILDPTLTHIIAPGNIVRSMMHFRISSTNEAVRMPLLGRSIVHEEGVQLITDYINSLDEPC
jgi:uncharacterized repeat protein (TIGR03806 family)